MLEGIIIKGIGGFYYVKVDDVVYGFQYWRPFIFSHYKDTNQFEIKSAQKAKF